MIQLKMEEDEEDDDDADDADDDSNEKLHIMPTCVAQKTD